MQKVQGKHMLSSYTSTRIQLNLRSMDSSKKVPCPCWTCVGHPFRHALLYFQTFLGGVWTFRIHVQLVDTHKHIVSLDLISLYKEKILTISNQLCVLVLDLKTSKLGGYLLQNSELEQVLSQEQPLPPLFWQPTFIPKSDPICRLTITLYVQGTSSISFLISLDAPRSLESYTIVWQTSTPP